MLRFELHYLPSCLQTGARVRRPGLGFPLLSPQARAGARSSLSVKDLIDHHDNAPFGGVERREGIQTALVIFLIFTLQATALDMFAAFDEDVRFKSVKRKRH